MMSKNRTASEPRQFTRHFSFHNHAYQAETRQTTAHGRTRDVPVTLPADQNTQRCLFVLFPKFSSITLAGAITTLSEANQLSGQTLYQWDIATCDGQNQNTSEGLQINTQLALFDIDPGDYSRLIICGGDMTISRNRKLQVWLQKAAAAEIHIGALGYGSYLLASAGLLDGYRCTTHWDYLINIRENFPETIVQQQLFIIDRDRFTCSGGNSVIDMMLFMIAQNHSNELASSIADVLVYERIRDPHEIRRPPISSMLGSTQPRIRDAIDIMEANIEEPLSLSELAHYVGISTRQLERLFSKYLDCMPSRYYMELRLTKAHQLLHQSHLSVTEIANVCGFSTTSHFSKSFREFFGNSPARTRSCNKQK